MNGELKWYVIVENTEIKLTDTQTETLSQLNLSPTYSEHDRVVEEFNSLIEANRAFKFYDNLLSK